MHWFDWFNKCNFEHFSKKMCVLILPKPHYEDCLTRFLPVIFLLRMRTLLALTSNIIIKLIESVDKLVIKYDNLFETNSHLSYLLFNFYSLWIECGKCDVKWSLCTFINNDRFMLYYSSNTRPLGKSGMLIPGFSFIIIWKFHDIFWSNKKCLRQNLHVQ